MIIDANLLLYARDRTTPRHERACEWLQETLNGPVRAGIPWQVLVGFVRIATNPRAVHAPLTPAAAWQQVEEWLAAPAAWIPVETDRHGEILGDLITRYDVTGPLVSDAHLAALALEHGVEIASADGDFARFSEVRWHNPLATP